MPTRLGRLILFLSSYIPLFVIFGILSWGNNQVVAMVSIAAFVVGAIGLTWFLLGLRRYNPEFLTPVDVRRGDGESMSYVVTYLLPFLSLNFADSRQLVAVALFFMVLGIIYVNSNMIHINPVLNIFGYGLYEVSTIEGASFVVVSRSRIVRNERISVVKVDEDILVVLGGN